MAKGKTVEIAEITKLLKKENYFGGIIKGNDYSKVKEYINSGNFHLNAVLSGSCFGGIPNNRTVCLAGESGTGKTFVLLNIIREAQKSGYHIIFYDSEGAVDIDTIESFGVDPEKFDYQPVSSLGKFRTSVTNLVKSLIDAKMAGKEVPKIMIALDSIGNLATQKEINDAIAGSEKADMTRAKSIRSIFRIITADLTGLDIPFVFTNHTYASTGLFPTTNVSGGGGVVYAPSMILAFAKKQIKEDGNLNGIIVKVKTLKNRFAKPTPIEFHIRFDKGMNPYIGLHEYISWDNCGIEKGNIITKSDFNKLNANEQEKCREFETKDGLKYFKPKETARNFVVKHLGDTVSIKDLFTPKVFTDEMIRELDEKFIKPKFAYGIAEDEALEINEFLENGETDDPES